MSATVKETARARIRLIVKGRVQGVGFRFAAGDKAKDLALAGWVRNLPNRDVEVVAEGNRKNLRLLADWAHRGPAYAMVDEVSEEWSAFSGDFKGFGIR